MQETIEKDEVLTEFTLSKKKVVINLLKLIPKMKKTRKRAEEIITNIKEPEKRVIAPDMETIRSDLEKICNVPHRRIGTKNAHEIESFLEETLKNIGIQDVKKEEFDLINWSATKWKLTVTNNGETMDVPCFYVLNTEFTGNEGITAPLIYIGAGTKKDFKKTDVKDKIVVADIVFPTLPLGKLVKLVKTYYVSDPTGAINEDSEIVLTFVLENFPPQALGAGPREDSVYWRAVRNGALGLVLILKDYPSNVNSHWGPYDGSMKPLPALYVGKYDGIKVREIAQSNQAQGTLILEGSKEPTIAHNIWGTLPGQSEESILVSSHHDSAFEGASEDGTGVAQVLAQARAWSKIPKENRPKTLVFLLTAGHLYGGKGAELFARKYKNTLLKNVLVDVNLEHMCAKEVDEDPETKDFNLTGNLALGCVFLSRNDVLIAHTIKAFREHEIENMLLIPDNFFATPPIGEAGHLAVHGDLKVIHWIRSPYYLLTGEDTMDKIDMSKLSPTAQCVSDLINSLMQLPREDF